MANIPYAFRIFLWISPKLHAQPRFEKNKKKWEFPPSTIFQRRSFIATKSSTNIDFQGWNYQFFSFFKRFFGRGEDLSLFAVVKKTVRSTISNNLIIAEHSSQPVEIQGDQNMQVCYLAKVSNVPAIGDDKLLRFPDDMPIIDNTFRISYRPNGDHPSQSEMIIAFFFIRGDVCYLCGLYQLYVFLVLCLTSKIAHASIMHMKLFLGLCLIFLLFDTANNFKIYKPNLPDGGKLVIVNELLPRVARRKHYNRNIVLLAKHMIDQHARIEDSLNLIYSRVNALVDRLKEKH